MPAVLVTGASGFLGPAVCRALLDRGFEVRGLTRSREARLEPGVSRFLIADLTDARSIESAVRGTSAVVHLAGRAHIADRAGVSSERGFQLANAEGTKAVLAAAITAGTKRILFASTIKVMGEYRGRPWTETDVPAPSDAYGRSKLAAEASLLGAAAKGDIEAGILRLPLVYGAGVKANMLQLFKLVDAGVPLPLGNIANRRSIVYAGNVAAGFLALLDATDLGGDVFFVSDGEAVSSTALIEMIAHSLGRPARLFSFPRTFLRGVARAADPFAGGMAMASPSAALARLTESLECSPEKIQSAFAFKAPWSTREGIALTARWYRESRQGIET